ncbi:hypothetical protein [Glutamicibacter arilaitensis]|uniref:hypothetical protein n=1 Tax=Glutamicibacter arilaitensis TaxID=256701 RepID=UPI00384FE0F5
MDPIEVSGRVTLSSSRPDYLVPTVGRIVHYLPPTRTKPLAAIITDVEEDDFVNLTVFLADGTTKPAKNVCYTEQLTEFCWTWPKRT